MQVTNAILCCFFFCLHPSRWDEYAIDILFFFTQTDRHFGTTALYVREFCLMLTMSTTNTTLVYVSQSFYIATHSHRTGNKIKWKQKMIDFIYRTRECMWICWYLLARAGCASARNTQHRCEYKFQHFSHYLHTSIKRAVDAVDCVSNERKSWVHSFVRVHNVVSAERLRNVRRMASDFPITLRKVNILCVLRNVEKMDWRDILSNLSFCYNFEVPTV